jgi:thymidylate kinase
MRLEFLNHVRYCVLHGWQGLPEHLPSDLDIVVAPEDLPHVEKALLEADGGRLVNLLQHESTCYYFVLAVPEDGEVRFLPVDVATDYRRDGRVWFTAGELLAGRQRWKDFWVASPEVEFSYLLVKKILKQDLPQHAADRLRELMLALGARAHILAEELLGKAWGLRISRWLEEGEWDTFRDHLGRLKKALRLQRVRRDPLNPFRYWVPELGRVWRRWRDPTGLFVAVLGPDGAGKSTVIEGLRKEMAGAFRRTARFHLMPGLLQRPSNSGPVTDPHGKPPRSWLFSLLKLAYYWLDYTLGYWLRIRPLLVRSTLVLFDRYYDDLLVDPRRYRYEGPMWLARLAGRLIPRPNLFIFLDLPAELTHTRKPEVALDEVRKLRDHYLALARSLPNATVVDASRPLEEVIAEAERIVLSYMEHRTRRRLGLDG